VFSQWGTVVPFDLPAVVEALQQDRRNLDAFQKTPGARAIRDYLELFAEDLDTIEQTARDLAAFDGPSYRRPYPAHLNVATTYGSEPRRSHRATDPKKESIGD
jgi:hypothetical protein